MSQQVIPFGRPMLDQAEIDAVVKVLSGSQLVHGPATREFEAAFAARVGATHAIAVSSCTAGLHLCLFVNGIHSGDEVIVPAMTHVATAHAVEFCGARPIFADVEEDTGNIDPDAAEAVVTDVTAAVMVVHYLGLPCDMNRINALAERAGAFIIEDCALALDATYNGRKAGTLGRAGCFSFYPVKHMTTIEGGMVTTEDAAMAKALAQRKAFGYDRSMEQRSVPGVYDVTELGYNYRMNEVEAAVGLVQLGKLDTFQKVRARNFNVLKSILAEINEVTVFEPTKGSAVSSHYCLNAVLPRDGRINRAAVVDELKQTGIGTSVHYPRPVPLMTYYREKYGYRPGQFPVAEWLADQTISLPIGPHLGEGDAERIGRAFATAIAKTRR